jgi:hypothetical protein
MGGAFLICCDPASYNDASDAPHEGDNYCLLNHSIVEMRAVAVGLRQLSGAARFAS